MNEGYPAASNGGGAGPLASVRIVEFAAIGPIPFAGMLLADMGADIVRLARPDTAAPSDPQVVQRGRRIVEVDLKRPEDVAKVMALLESADILLEGYRPGVMERLGFSPGEVLKRNPRIVFGRMTGWGQTGPLAAAAGHDINYISVTGALAAMGGKSAPAIPLNLVGDYGGGGLYLIVGVLAALLHARATGQGQVVDAAMCDGAASLMSVFYDLTAKGQWRNERSANVVDGGAPYYGVFECADGKFVSIGAIEPQFYADLLRRLGLADDPLFGRQNGRDAWPAMRQRLETVFKSKPRAEWCALLEGTDVCFAPILAMDESPQHPHMVARGTFVDIAGTRQPAPAPRFGATPSTVRRSATGFAIEDVIAGWGR